MRCSASPWASFKRAASTPQSSSKTCVAIGTKQTHVYRFFIKNTMASRALACVCPCFVVIASNVFSTC